MDETDTYVYSEHLFISSDIINELGKYIETLNEEQYKKGQKPNLSNKEFDIYSITSSPIWVFKNPILNNEIPYYLDSDVRVMAETTTITCASVLFSEISKFLLNNKNLSYTKKIKLIKTKNSYSEILRNVSLNYALILQQIRFRYNDSDYWQMTYEDAVRVEEASGILEAEKLYKVSEQNLINLIQAIENEENSRHQKRIELLLLLFSGITLGSAYVDIISFIETNQSNFTQVNFHFLETRFLFLLVAFMVIIIIYISRRRKY